jgi:hypothetical protein
MGVPVATLVKVLETIFVAGILGSVVVLILTTIEDLEIMFESDAAGTEPPAIEEQP